MIVYCPRCGTPYPEIFLGEVQDTSRRCPECALSVADAPATLAAGNPEDEVQYDLAEWEMHERSSATTALLDVDIPYRWEADLVLVVPAVAEVEVDQLLDDLEPLDDAANDDDDVEDGGEEAHEAMTELFVAADRLQHDPADTGAVADVLIAAGTVGVSAPPYGIERPVWKRIQELAATVATDLEESADEDTVAADARALREYLRDLV
jgi:hypothetical protein